MFEIYTEGEGKAAGNIRLFCRLFGIREIDYIKKGRESAVAFIIVVVRACERYKEF